MVRENAFGSMSESDSELIGTFYHIRVLERTGRSDNGFDPGFRGCFDRIIKREESVAGHHRAFQRPLARIFLAELLNRLFDRADTILLAGSDGKSLTVFHDHNAVGTDTDIDVPCGKKILKLFRGRFDGGGLSSAYLVFTGRWRKIGDGADIRQERSPQ